MSSLTGLQNYYHGDSDEISDSEGESSPSRIPVTASGIVSSGLGIPRTSTQSVSPPGFVKPPVQLAPSISLVGYNEEDEKDNDATIEDDVTDLNSQSLQQQLLLPPSLIDLVNRHSPAQSNENERSPSPESDVQLFFVLTDMELPPEPSDLCSQELQDKITGYLQKKQKLGITPYDVIVRSKSFRNPSIYKKFIEVCNIEEFGTNYPKKKFDPNEWKPEDYYEKLAEAQKKAHENKQRSRAERSKIEFKSGSGSGLLPLPTGSSLQESQKRRSKWDVPSNDTKGSSVQSNTNSSAVGAQALVNARLIDKNLMKLFKS